MVRSTWVGKSMKKNNVSRRYVKTRFVSNEHYNTKDHVNQINEDIEINLISTMTSPSTRLLSSDGESNVNILDNDPLNETNGELNSKTRNSGLCLSNQNEINDCSQDNNLDKSFRDVEAKKKTLKNGNEDYEQKPKPLRKKSSILVFGGIRSRNNIELTEESSTSSVQCQPRIHTHNDSNTGRNVVELAWVTLAIVFIFMICHSIKWIANFYEMIMVSYYNKTPAHTYLLNLNVVVCMRYWLFQNINYLLIFYRDCTCARMFVVALLTITLNGC
jgi:hypothetical protein